MVACLGYLAIPFLKVKSNGNLQNSSPQIPAVSVSLWADQQTVLCSQAVLLSWLCLLSWVISPAPALAVTCMLTTVCWLFSAGSGLDELVALCPIVTCTEPASSAQPHHLHLLLLSSFPYCLPLIAHNQILYVFCCVINTDQTQLKEERVSLAYTETLQFIVKSEQELKNWSRSHGWMLFYWLAFRSFLNLLIPSRTTCAGGATAHSDLGPLTAIINQEYAP